MSEPAGGGGELSPRDRPALAPNWRSPLLVDAGLGLLAVAVGLYLLVSGGPAGLGVVVIGLGFGYVALVARRWRRWAGLRRGRAPR